jgi:adenosylcobinamide-phosphate synthase
MTTGFIALLAAVAADALLGDPPAWPHFVRWLGGLITWLEAKLRRLAMSPVGLRLAGVALVMAVVGAGILGARLALAISGGVFSPLGLLVGAAISFQCLAAGQLWREARAVHDALRADDLALARARLGLIVGRDTGALDEAGVRRAVIETVAENLNDGVVAPLFYLALGGPVWGVAYKAVNTLDSMVGYKDERYADLGWAAARVDDLAGWAPARLTALVITLACPLVGLAAGEAWRAALADHAAHKSPNAGWPEAAAAGALGVRLGGPSLYTGRLVEKPWLNPQARQPEPADLDAALNLLVAGAAVASALALLAAWVLRGW